MKALKAAVFLDRDGVINEDPGYVHLEKDLKLLPDSAKAISLLNQKGLPVIVVTNQAGIAYGMYTEDDLHKFQKVLNEKLEKFGAKINAFYYCPHHAEKGKGKYQINCACRKPKTGMFEQAAKNLNIALKRSFVIGDKWSDVIPGQTLGCKTIMLKTGHGQKEAKKPSPSGRQFDYMADNLYQAVIEYILKER